MNLRRFQDRRTGTEHALRRIPDRRTTAVCIAALAAVTTALAVRPLGPGPVRLEIGAFESPFAGSGWSRSARADVDEATAAGDATSFYFRALPLSGPVPIPLEADEGTVRLVLRGTARVRSSVGVFLAGERGGEMLVRPGPWFRHVAEAPHRGGPLHLSVAVRPLAQVRRAESTRPDILVDYLELEAPEGLRLRPGVVLTLALVPILVALFAALVGFSPRSVAATGAASALAVCLLARAAPLATALAAPRLIPAAVLAGLASFALCRALSRLGAVALPAGGLAALVAAGVALHGSIVFFPNHSPPDLEIHVRRALDLGSVPLDYRAILRYGSQLPTESQDLGAATAALGERTLIPYSPLPYVFYYALHAAGLDLFWAMPVFNAVVVLLALPLLWGLTRRIFDAEAAWLASLLYLLDLAVWHHFGRHHAPAVFGGGLATAALCALAWSAPQLDRPRRVLSVAGLLALAVLGYSSLVVLMTLFGLVLLVALSLGAWDLSHRARMGAASALILGGGIALCLFYGHYVPGLLVGARGVEAEPDLFPGRTFLVFHNESRQAMRLWALGLWIPLGAGILAAPLALRRAPAWARPFLVAWLAAWALILLLKEPWLFPKLLRWAKEDQFVSPLMGLLVAGAIGRLRGRATRLGAAAVVLAIAAFLQARDLAHHARSLLL